jgi:hypothetical protein
MKFTPFVVVSLASARVIRVPRDQQQVPIIGDATKVVMRVPETSHVKEAAEDVAPGIGVHFTTSYAVAAARFQNGTIRDLVRIDGDAEYIDLMSRWVGSYSDYESSQDW